MLPRNCWGTRPRQELRAWFKPRRNALTYLSLGLLKSSGKRGLQRKTSWLNSWSTSTGRRRGPTLFMTHVFSPSLRAGYFSIHIFLCAGCFSVRAGAGDQEDQEDPADTWWRMVLRGWTQGVGLERVCTWVHSWTPHLGVCCAIPFPGLASREPESSVRRIVLLIAGMCDYDTDNAVQFLDLDFLFLVVCRANRYDGIQELWVVVRETATHAEIQEVSETHKSRRKVPFK